MVELNLKAEDNSAPEFQLLPKGYYRAVALKEELKTTKAGTGSYISVEFEVVESKRKIWANYNIVNPNPKAQEIAEKDLKSFAWAVGLENLRNSSDLLFKEVQLYVDIEQGSLLGYKPQNVVKGYYPAQWTVDQIAAHRGSKAGAATSVPTASAPTAASQSAVGAGGSPWARK